MMVSSVQICLVQRPFQHTDQLEALATFAASCAIVLSIVQMYATRLGAGLHEKEIDPNNMEMLMKVRYPLLSIHHNTPTNPTLTSWS